MSKRGLGLFYAALIIPAGRPDIEIKNFNLVESQASVRTLEMQAQKAQLFQEERIGLLHQILSKVWSANGGIYEIRSKIAALDTAKQDFKTEGPTSIVTPDSYSLNTENISYNAEERTLTGVEPVELAPLSDDKIKGAQDFHLKGSGLTVLLKQDVFRIENDVKANQALPNNERLLIVSKKFEFDSLKNTGRFLTNVSVKHPQYTMFGQKLELNFKKDSEGTSTLKEMFLQSGSPSSKVKAKIGETQFRSRGLRIHFDKESNVESSEAIGAAEADLENDVILKAERLFSFTEDGIQKIRMTGNVDIITPTRTAKCGEALYIPSTGDFILEKVASLKDADQVIEGEKIFFSTTHNKLRVEKASGSLGKDQFKKISD